MQRKVGNILWGLAFVVIGLCYAGNAFGLWKFNLFFKGWWTLFLIIPCLFGILINGFSISKFIGLAIGVVLLLNEQNVIAFKFINKLIFPIILVIIGINIITNSTHTHKRIDGTLKIKGDVSGFTKDNKLNLTALFGGVERTISNEVFNGASMFSMFGGIDLDLKDAYINDDIKIDAVCIFGGVDIIVPSNVRVEVSGVPIFGGTSNLAKSPIDQNAPTIYIESICIFGGIDIK